MMDVRHAARNRILDRDHRKLGLPVDDRRESIFEGRRGQHRPVGMDLLQAMWEFAPSSPWNEMILFMAFSGPR